MDDTLSRDGNCWSAVPVHKWYQVPMSAKYLGAQLRWAGVYMQLDSLQFSADCPSQFRHDRYALLSIPSRKTGFIYVSCFFK